MTEIVVLETQDPGAWAYRYEPIRQQIPVTIRLFVECGVMTLGPASEAASAFMQRHEPWFQELFAEVGERYLHSPMRVAKERRGEWSRDVIQPPDGMIGLINARLFYAFGPLVQCKLAPS